METADVSNESQLREAICRFGRSLFERGLTAGSSGNISVRLGDGGWLTTPTNSSLGFLDPARLSRLDADGRLVSGDAPTKELPLHTALYATRTDSGAIVHLHSTHSVAVSMLPDVNPANALPPMTAYYVMRVGRTALVPYYRPGDPAVADAIRGLAGRYSAVLLANHGPVVAGRDLEAAVYATEELEETAKLRLLLHGLNPRLLTRAQVRDLVTHFELDEAIGHDAADSHGTCSKPHDHSDKCG
jgi:ribulose-5-phosphate 4-epimerase/fuculose-1-phosphate aldolase